MSIEKKTAVITAETQEDAVKWHQSLISEAKSMQTTKIKFAAELCEGYAKGYHKALGYDDFDVYVKEKWSGRQFHQETISSIKGAFDKLRAQLEPSVTSPDAHTPLVTKNAMKMFMDLNKAADGNHSYLREVVRYKITDDMDKALGLLKKSESWKEMRDGLRTEFAGKEVQPKMVAGQLKAHNSYAVEYVNVSFAIPKSDLDSLGEIFEIHAKKIGTPKPFIDMNSAERGRLLTHIATSTFGETEEELDISSDEAVKFAAQEHLKAAVGLIMKRTGRELDPATFKRFMAIFSDAIERSGQAAA